jgi:hypothetical protein
MKWLTTQLIILLAIYFQPTTSKVKLTLSSYSKSKILLRGAQQQTTPLVYITLLEGSRDIYATCESICTEKSSPLYYAEVTDFPNYGKIFRCQCGDKYTPWHNLNDLSELCTEILLGDELFNGYFNLLGYDTSDCKCDDLKYLLGKLIMNQS